MREAGHDGVGMLFGPIDQRNLHCLDAHDDAVDGRAQVHPRIGGDLVVARTSGMQALAGVADQYRQPFLDVEVNVLEVDRPREAAGRDLLTDFGHAALNVGEILRAQHADGVQHPRVGERALDVERGERLIESCGSGEALDQIRHRLAEPAGPAAGRRRL